MNTQLADRIVDVTAGLVAIPTHETEQVAQERLAEILAGAGFECELQRVATNRPNLIARRGSGGTFVCSHIDTHPPHGHPEPFTCKRRGGILVGRGVLDAKGQIAAAVAAAEADPDAPLTFVITCDEEAGGLGSERLHVPDGPWREDGGIVLEPTAFRMCTAQGGHIDLVLEASAPSTHAYAPRATRSPIDVILDAVEAVRSLPSLDERHPLLPAPRAHLGHVQGGEHLWRTPGGARAEVSIGLVPSNDPEAVTKEIRKRLDEVANGWDAEGGSFLFEIVDTSEPIELPVDLPIVTRLASVLGSDEPSGISSWTDAGNLLVHHGIPCAIFGAGELAPAHSNHEWVEVGDLVRLSELLVDVFRTDGTAR